jgi:hypothetical protein
MSTSFRGRIGKPVWVPARVPLVAGFLICHRNGEIMTAEEFGRKYLLWILLVIAAFFVVKYYFGVTLPGSFFERGREYQAKVYVLLYPEGADAKNYRVPADIYK